MNFNPEQFPIGILTPSALLLLAVWMLLRGSLVPKSHLVDRMSDRDKIIQEKDRVIQEQDRYIGTLENQVQIASRGNQTTLRVMEALPEVTSPTAGVDQA